MVEPEGIPMKYFRSNSMGGDEKKRDSGVEEMGPMVLRLLTNQPTNQHIYSGAHARHTQNITRRHKEKKINSEKKSLESQFSLI